MSAYPPDYSSWSRERQNARYTSVVDQKRQGAPSVVEQKPFVSLVSDSHRHISWPQPTPLPSGLAPVRAFDLDLLPASVAPWIADISERMQCPPDFVAIPAIVALGSVLGRKIGVRPQRRTDWIEVPNLWGCIVGRPGAMKSPAMSEALKPLNRTRFQGARRAFGSAEGACQQDRASQAETR